VRRSSTLLTHSRAKRGETRSKHEGTWEISRSKEARLTSTSIKVSTIDIHPSAELDPCNMASSNKSWSEINLCKQFFLL